VSLGPVGSFIQAFYQLKEFLAFTGIQYSFIEVYADFLSRPQLLRFQVGKILQAS
jgi:hypothetical protein